MEGNSYLDPVFNETVQIVEYDEGFDTEVFFMYVTLAAAVILLLFLVYTFLPGMTDFWVTWIKTSHTNFRQIIML